MTEVQQRFCSFVEERERARIRKEVLELPAPWSEDPVLAAHRFCNVNREDDRVTRFIAARVRSRCQTINEAVTSMTAARIFNEPDVLERMVWPVNEGNVGWNYKILQELQQSRKLFRGAYMMPAHVPKGQKCPALDDWTRVIREVSRIDFDATVALDGRLLEVFTILTGVHGLGDFLANQIVTDLRYEFGHAFKHPTSAAWTFPWEDWTTFIRCGPGTRRGMSRFDGEKPSTNGNPEERAQRLLTIREVLHDRGYLSDFYEVFRDPNNLSNCFCEFDKYERGREQLNAGEKTTLRKYGNQKS